MNIEEPISSSIFVLSVSSRCHLKAYEALSNDGLPHKASFLCAESHIMII